jgi:hypothetical protein
MTAASARAAEKAVAKRNRQYRLYTAAKKREMDRLYADPEHGDRLRKFVATLGHFGIDDANRMIEYVRYSCNWLRAAPEDIRFAALQQISHRVQRIRARAGLLPFDDPLPGEEEDVFRVCKGELGL